MSTTVRKKKKKYDGLFGIIEYLLNYAVKKFTTPIMTMNYVSGITDTTCGVQSYSSRWMENAGTESHHIFFATISYLCT
jgi:hypothetical protein